MSDLSLEEIKPMLQARALSLASELAPGGRREGNYYVAPNPARADDRIGSFKVFLTGEAAGGFVEYDSGEKEKGSVFDLIIYARKADDIKGARRWALNWLGLADLPIDQVKSRAKSAARKQHKADAEEEARREYRRKAAYEIWCNGERLAPGDWVVRYLESRGLALAPELLARIPLRLAPALKYIDDGAATYWPTMLAPMQSPGDGRLMAVHRTYLAPDGSGKAPVPSPKRMLGSKSGAYIRLWRSVVGSDHIVVTEGIEDGLTLALADPALNVHVVGDLGNLAKYQPIAGAPVKRLTVMADDDGDNPAAQKALSRALDALADRFADVRVAKAPGAKDINAYLTKKEKAS